MTDPRDYVYGLLGVLESRSLDPGIEVDYSSTIEEVFQRATVRFFARKQGLGVFSRECVEPGSRPRPTMPSWVRNFGYSQPRFIHRVINEIEEKLGDEQVLFAEGDSLTAHGLIIDSIKQVSGNFMAKNVKRIVLQAFTSHLSVFSEKSRTDVVMAARKTLQSVDCSLNSSLPEQTFFSLLSFWQLEDLGLTLHVLSQNPKFGVIVTTNPKLQRWFPDETENDTQIMDLIPKNVVLQWATEQHSSTEDLANCDSDLRFRLFSEDSALGVNMFTGTKGFLGIGPAGRNSSPDDPPAVHVGDHITLFPTLSKPMILRDRSDGSYTLVGTAHVGNLLEIPWYEGESPKLVPLRLR